MKIFFKILVNILAIAEVEAAFTESKLRFVNNKCQYIIKICIEISIW